MSYEPTTWKAGDTVTSAKLNKMEQGIANENNMILLVHEIDGTLDKTWTEIRDADISFIINKASEEEVTNGGSSTNLIISTSYFDGDFMVNTINNQTYIASSIDGYPSI